MEIYRFKQIKKGNILMRIYNTLSHKVEEFVPNEPGKVSMYTCGPTVYHFAHTMPEGVSEQVHYVTPDPASWGEKGVKALNAGHGGGDYWIVQNMIDYFANGVTPFFDVYKGVAMSATAILGWRSCLNHGENFRIPDFSKEEERIPYENDDATPFPDSEGKGNTVPPSTMYGKY